MLKKIAMIPARIGSERFEYKNIQLLAGKPVIGYAIEAAKRSRLFSKIVLNGDHPVFEKIAKDYEIDFYMRPKAFGSSETRSDVVVADFMENNPGDLLVWVNSIAPLQPYTEIISFVHYILEQDLDTCITVKKEYLHSMYDGTPLNFSYDTPFEKTQNLKPVESFVYSLMGWRYETFLAQYNINASAILSGKVGFFPVSKLSSILIKYPEDLRVCEALLASNEICMNKNSYIEVLEDE